MHAHSNDDSYYYFFIIYMYRTFILWKMKIVYNLLSVQEYSMSS